MNKTSANVVWHHVAVERAHRERLNGHRSTLLWFTGLSGAGKSTLAHAVEEKLHALRVRTYVLDGDNVRHGLWAIWGSRRRIVPRTSGVSVKWPSCSSMPARSS